MKPVSSTVRSVLDRELLYGTVRRVDMDRVDVVPDGSSTALRSLPLVGDREKVYIGCRVQIVTSHGQRAAMAPDLALETATTQQAKELPDETGKVVSRALRRLSIPRTVSVTNIVLSKSGAYVAEYPYTHAGLKEALEDATPGDLLTLPSGKLEGGPWTLKGDVTLMMQGNGPIVGTFKGPRSGEAVLVNVVLRPAKGNGIHLQDGNIILRNCSIYAADGFGICRIGTVGQVYQYGGSIAGLKGPIAFHDPYETEFRIVQGSDYESGGFNQEAFLETALQIYADPDQPWKFEMDFSRAKKDPQSSIWNVSLNTNFVLKSVATIPVNQEGSLRFTYRLRVAYAPGTFAGDAHIPAGYLAYQGSVGGQNFPETLTKLSPLNYGFGTFRVPSDGRWTTLVYDALDDAHLQYSYYLPDPSAMMLGKYGPTGTVTFSIYLTDACFVPADWSSYPNPTYALTAQSKIEVEIMEIGWTAIDRYARTRGAYIKLWDAATQDASGGCRLDVAPAWYHASAVEGGETGVPMAGDRAAYDTGNYSDYHASDIADGSYTYHLPPDGLTPARIGTGNPTPETVLYGDGSWGDLPFTKSETVVSDPPTQAELTAALGNPSSVRPSFVGVIKSATKAYRVWTDGTDWYFMEGTKAV